jgi:benzodiazapine receptor
MKPGELGRLAFCIIICQLAGAIGSVFTIPAIAGWYATLQKPWFTPPNWLFGPVWISLYTLMGIALYLVWQKGLRKNGLAVGVFGAQLALNAAWSFLFFGLQNPFLGLVSIIALWIFIALSIWAFWRIDRRAGYLLVPYIAWVSIAAALNYYVWILNA